MQDCMMQIYMMKTCILSKTNINEFFNLPLGSIIFGNTALIVRTKDGKEEKYHFRLKYYHEVKEIAERVEDRFPSATQPQQ